MTEDQVMAALRAAGIANGVMIITKWKDGIDIDVPSAAAMIFAEAIVRAQIRNDTEKPPEPFKPVSDERAVGIAHAIATGKVSAIDGTIQIMDYATDAILQERQFDASDKGVADEVSPPALTHTGRLANLLVGGPSAAALVEAVLPKSARSVEDAIAGGRACTCDKDPEACPVHRFEDRERESR